MTCLFFGGGRAGEGEVEHDSFMGIVGLGGRRFVGITSCSLGNCTATSCLVAASIFFSLSMFTALACSWYEVTTL